MKEWREGVEEEWKWRRSGGLDSED